MKPSERELPLRMEAAELELIQAVEGIMGKHGLPCFLLEPIFDKVHRQLSESKKRETDEARLREAMAATDAENGEE